MIIKIIAVWILGCIWILLGHVPSVYESLDEFMELKICPPFYRRIDYRIAIKLIKASRYNDALIVLNRLPVTYKHTSLLLYALELLMVRNHISPQTMTEWEVYDNWTDEVYFVACELARRRQTALANQVLALIMLRLST